MQAQAYGRSNAARLESTRASSLANAQTSIDAAIFVQWVNAYAHNEPRLATFYFDRFRREFRPAVDAWIATNALHNPSAPLTPFAMPQYKLAATADANRLAEMAAQASEQAKAANQRGDNYVLAIVLFATALFFAGISTQLEDLRNRAGIIGLGCLIFLAAVVWIATFPVSLSI